MYSYTFNLHRFPCRARIELVVGDTCLSLQRDRVPPTLGIRPTITTTPWRVCTRALLKAANSRADSGTLTPTNDIHDLVDVSGLGSNLEMKMPVQIGLGMVENLMRLSAKLCYNPLLCWDRNVFDAEDSLHSATTTQPEYAHYEGELWATTSHLAKYKNDREGRRFTE